MTATVEAPNETAHTSADPATKPEPPAVNQPATRTLLSIERLATSALIIVAMSVIATSGFRTIFSSWAFLIQAIVGASLAALLVLLGRRFELLAGEVIAIALVAPLLVGPVMAGGLGFYNGAANGWAEILSATPPVDLSPELRALPFLAAYLGGFAGTQLARMRDLPGLGIVGPLATLVLTALFTEQTRAAALTVGLVLLVGLLLLARLHLAAVTQTGVLVLILVLGLVAGVASTGSLLLPLAEEDTRFDLRDLQTPPWNPLSVPSPITELKGSLKAADPAEQPILRVTGAVPVSRWRTASLPAYNGVYWSVAEPDSPSEFVAIDSVLPAIADEADRSDPSVRYVVDVLAPIGTWLPTGGVPSLLDFGQSTDARMSLNTGTIAVPTQLHGGDSFSITFDRWPELTDDELRELVFVADDRSAELALLPPVVRNLAADFSTGIGQLSGERVMAIRNNLQLGSYDVTEPPGHSFGRIANFLQQVEGSGQARLEEDLRALVGHEELYSATAGVLLRQSDIPTRVATGYQIPDDRWNGSAADIYRSDASAWVEVRVDDRGWLPINVTPDRDREPIPIDRGTETEGVPVADPPKAPPPPEDTIAPEVEEPDTNEQEEEPEEEVEDEASSTLFGLGTAALVGAITPLIALVLAAVGVVLTKVSRRRRRRTQSDPADQVTGAWTELVDRVRESGATMPAQATPSEAAAHAQRIPGLQGPAERARVVALADHVHSAAFHPLPPSAGAAEQAWDDYDHLANALAEPVGSPTRLRRSIDPRPLLPQGSRGSQ